MSIKLIKHDFTFRILRNVFKDIATMFLPCLWWEMLPW